MSDYLTAEDFWKVQNILWEVSEKWFDIGIQLKLTPSNLKMIEADYKKVEDCCREMLHTWLTQEPEPTWAALVEALKSPPVKCDNVARKIELEHLPKPESSQDQVYLDEIPSTTNINNLQNAGFHDDEESDEDSEVKVKMDELDERFSDLVSHTYRVLVKDQGFTLSDIRLLFNSFPSTRRHEHQEFLEKYIVRMEHDVTIDDLWSQLCSYWHFINYKLLKYIIRKSSCKKLIEEMESYEEDLKSFSKETSLHDFVKCFPKLSSQSLRLAAGSNHRLEVKVGGKICKLIHLDRLEKGFVSTFSLPEICGLILKKMSPGCFLITWMVPAPYIKLLRWKLSICDEQFFRRHDVESVHLDGEVCYVKGSERTPINPAIEQVLDLKITKKTFELEAMTKKVMESSPPLTMTQLCTTYTCKVLTHHLSHHPVHGKSNLKIQSFTDLPQDMHKQFLHLCQLAYKGILAGYKGEISLLLEHTDGLGLTVDFEGRMYFIHRMLQEYLAAVYISNTIREGITDYFKEFLNLPYFGYLPYFIAGLTKLTFMTGQMLLMVIQRTSKYLLMFESEFPRVLTKKTMSNLIEFTDTTIVNDVMSILKGVKISTRNFKSVINLTSTKSNLSVDSGLGHSILGNMSASTRSNLSMNSELGLHSSVRTRSTPTSSDLRVDSRQCPHSSDGIMSVSNISNFSVDSGLGSVGTKLSSDLSMASRLGHSSVGTRSISTRSDLSVPDNIIQYYSQYITGRLLPLSDHNWKLTSMNEFMVKGFIDATVSVCNYKGDELPSQNFKLTIDSVNYKCLSYLPYCILNRIEAIMLYNLSEEGICELQSISTKLIILHEVYLKYRFPKIDTVTPFLSNLKMLKILNLGWNVIGEDGTSEIAKTLLVNQSLEELNIEHNGITDKGASILAEGLQRNKTLKILNLAGNKICDDGTSEIAETLLVNQSLEELNIEHNDITDRGASALAKGLHGNNTLKILNLGWNSIGDNGTSEIAKMLSVNQSLEELNIVCNNIKGRSVSILAESLRENKSLKILNLGWNNIGDDGTSEIAKTLLVNQSLEELNVICNHIGYRGVSALAEGLQGNNTLKILNLGRNKIGDDGASEIAKTLLVNQSLEELNIKDNHITDKGASALAESLQGSNTLKILHLGGDNIGDDGASEIAKALLVNQSLEELNIEYNHITYSGKSALHEGLHANRKLKVIL